jgi:hypothetical protein
MESRMWIRDSIGDIMKEFGELRMLLSLAWILLVALLWRTRGSWAWRRQRKNIPMDAGQWLVADNREVSIGPLRIHQGTGLAAAGAAAGWGFGLIVWFALPLGILEPSSAWTWIRAAIGMGTALLAAAGVLWAGARMQPAIRISSPAGEAVWTRGLRIRRIPFESISHIQALFSSSVKISVHRTYTLKQAEPGSEIYLALKDGSWIPLAAFTGEKPEPRTLETTRLIADAIGVPVKVTKNK